MYYEKRSRAFNLLAGLTLGIATGAGLAFLLKPQNGGRARHRSGR